MHKIRSISFIIVAHPPLTVIMLHFVLIGKHDDDDDDDDDSLIFIKALSQ